MPMTPEQQAEVDRYYDQLKPEAQAAARNYVLSHTPPELQEGMLAKVDADFPEPVPAEPAPEPTP